MKCDKCDNQATVHLIEIENGEKIEKHLCEQHAVEAGVTAKSPEMPINELLENFVLKHSGAEKPQSEVACEHCGLTYSEFRKRGLLGCPVCYETFERALVPLLERYHEGSSQHIGKMPCHSGVDELRQQRLRQIRRELDEAVASEHYERAARLRDDMRRMEAEKS
jgi:protein arginine kinase activator